MSSFADLKKKAKQVANLPPVTAGSEKSEDEPKISKKKSFADLKKQVRQEVETPAPVEKPKISNDINTREFDSKKTYLVVNGKPKEISKKSKYLLDMLIIEEDN